MAIVGAEGVVESGGIISRLGTYQLGLLAKAAGKPFYVVAESHKFVRLYPLSQYDLPIDQRVLDFRTADDGESNGERARPTQTPHAAGDESKQSYFESAATKKASTAALARSAVDFTVSSAPRPTFTSSLL